MCLHTLTSINKMASNDTHLKSDISTNGYYRNLFRSRQHKSKKLIECLAILFTAGADFKPLRRQSSSRAVNSVCGLSSNPHWDIAYANYTPLHFSRGSSLTIHKHCDQKENVNKLEMWQIKCLSFSAVWTIACLFWTKDLWVYYTGAHGRTLRDTWYIDHSLPRPIIQPGRVLFCRLTPAT